MSSATPNTRSAASIPGPGGLERGSDCRPGHRRPWTARSAWPILAILLAVTLLALLYMAQTPPYEGADADAHFRYIAFLRREPRRPTVDAATAAISHELVQQPPLYYALAAAATWPWPLEPALDLYVFNPHYPEFGPRSTITPPHAPPHAELPLRVAALVSLLGALLTVALVWLTVRALVPGDGGLAVLAAATVGLNPQFLFAASTVTNDTWIAATMAAAVWAALRAAQRPQAGRPWLVAGSCAAAAMLTKYTGLGVLVIIGLVWLYYLGHRGWRRGLWAGLACGLAVAVVAGWWYAYNLLHYQSLVPFAQIQAILSTHARQKPAGLASLVRQLEWLWRTYWGVFGYGVMAPTWFFRWLDVWTGLAGIGLLAFLPLRYLRARKGGARSREAPAVVPGELVATALGVLWLGVVLAGILQFMRWVVGGNQGRLLFPAAGAVGLLLALGWTALMPRQWKTRLQGLSVAGLALLALSQAATLAHAYAMPQPLRRLPELDRPTPAEFAPGMALLGARLPQGGSVVGGEPLPLVLYWRAVREIDSCFKLIVHLADDQDRLFGAFDGVPFGGRHPTRQWRPGEVFADPYQIATPLVDHEVLASIVVSFYDPITGERQPILNARGQVVADRAVLGHVRIRRTAPAIVAPTPPLAGWTNGIELVAARPAGSISGGEPPQSVTLEWRTRQPVHQDLTIFVQLLGADGRLLRQDDARPLNGAEPTDTWVPGYSWRTEHRLLGTGDAADWRQLIVGFYDANLQRLPVAEESGGGDHWVLARRVELR